MATNAPRPITRRGRFELLNGIYVILNEGPGLFELARAVLDAGVKLLQYRAKGGIVPKSLGILRAMTSEFGALLIVDDDWRAAIEFDCDGAHLGPGDDGFEEVGPVRASLGDRLIGLSCGSLVEVQTANQSDVDYLGVGSLYVTSSKPDAGAPIGTAELLRLVRASTLPVAAIGGITAETIPEIRASGAAMAAVLSAICNATDPQLAARELVDAWQR